jgi:hypothetical protein
MNRWITSFLLTLLTFSPISNSLGKANSNHIIAGYGAVGGDLFVPTNVQFFGGKMLVLDQFGVSTFEVVTRKFLSRFPVDLGRTDKQGKEINSTFLEEQATWMEIFKNFSYKTFLSFIAPKGPGNVDGPASLNVRNKFTIDSTGNCYLLGSKEIQVYQSDGTMLKSLPIPENKDFKSKQDTVLIDSIKIYEDKLFLYRYFLDKGFKLKLSVYIINLNGEIEKEIKINQEVVKKVFFSPHANFVYLSDLKLFCFHGFSMDDFSPIPFILIDHNGDLVESKHDLDIVNPYCLASDQKDRIIFYGQHTKSYTDTPKEFIFIISAKASSDGTIIMTKEDSFEDELVKKVGVDLAISGSTISLIIQSPDDQQFNNQVLLIQKPEIVRVGSTPYHNPSQIFGSMAFCITSDGSLFTNNLTDQSVNHFSSDGSFIDQIECPIEEQGILDLIFKPLIYDMCLLQDAIYFSSTASNRLLIKYNTLDKQWSSSQIILPDSKEKPTFLCMETDQKQIYLLDTNKINKNTPNFFVLTQDENGESTAKQIKLRDYPDFDIKNVPLFVDFKIIDSEYYFLECANSEIWIYNKEKGLYKDRILLPKSDKNFYSSLSVYPDGTFLLTDTIQCNLIHVSKTGELIETIGEKGEIAVGTTKEAYLEKPNQFFVPFRAKIANDKIYVSDLFNCRYHIIPITKPEPKPTIQWEQESIKLDRFSVFSEKIIDLPFTVTPTKEFPFALATSVPWIQLKSENGKSTDQQISLKILGDKLTPWQTNTGNIQVTFPDYPELNKTIPITVDATGNIVKVTIGSSKATLNDQEITLDSASIPLLKKGRTFVGIRFMGEIVFSNTAKISYDAMTQTVYFEIGLKKIELTINQPYALVNGAKVTLDAPPFIQTGRTFVPLRFISENLDATVEYEAKTQSITITYPKRIHT